MKASARLRLSAKLRLLRTNNNLTQTTIAQIAGIAPNTYCQYESGARKPDNEILCKIADYYGVTIDYLLGREEQISELVISEEYVDEKPKVYWAERTSNGWEVLSGYYLGSYKTYFGVRYIITLGEITSCVVRHLEDFYHTKKEAWASIAELELKQ